MQRRLRSLFLPLYLLVNPTHLSSAIPCISGYWLYFNLISQNGKMGKWIRLPNLSLAIPHFSPQSALRPQRDMKKFSLRTLRSLR